MTDWDALGTHSCASFWRARLSPVENLPELVTAPVDRSTR
jgi:hypothetical protein